MEHPVREDSARVPLSVEERAMHASEMLQTTCSAKGIPVASWYDFRGWQDYVEGHISESELTEKAKAEVCSLPGSPCGLVVIGKENPLPPSADLIERRRAKLANRIYQEAYRQHGMTLRFFNTFLAWNHFVQGKLNESEFHTVAHSELEPLVRQEAVSST